jgi:hypothetical protein
MTPPIWLDEHGARARTGVLDLWSRGGPMRFRAEHLRPHGWAPPPTLHVPDCSERLSCERWNWQLVSGLSLVAGTVGISIGLLAS